MVLRLLAGSFLFFLCYLVESSFIAFLPSPFDVFPLLFLFSLYGIQHLRSPVFGWGLVGMGLLDDLFLRGFIPFETGVMVIAAAVALLSVRHLFIQRSWYGLLGCSLVTYVVIQVFSFSYVLILSFVGQHVVPWKSIAITAGWQLLFLFLGTVFCSLLFSRLEAYLLRHVFVGSRSS